MVGVGDGALGAPSFSRKGTVRKNLRLRLRIASRLLAVWLAVLIAAPVTAPLRTWHLTTPADGVQFHDAFAGDRLSKEVTPPAPAFHGAPVSPAVVVCLDLLSKTATSHQALLTVLRL
jgi:hypothetical protein